MAASGDVIRDGVGYVGAEGLRCGGKVRALKWPKGRPPHKPLIMVFVAWVLISLGVSVVGWFLHWVWLLLPVLALLWTFVVVKSENACFAQLKRQLQDRREFALELWGSEVRAEVATKMAKLIAEDGEWPNFFFIPNDPFEIVFWQPYPRGGEFSNIFAEFEKLNIGPIDSSRLVAIKTLGEFVDYCIEPVKGRADGGGGMGL